MCTGVVCHLCNRSHLTKLLHCYFCGVWRHPQARDLRQHAHSRRSCRSWQAQRGQCPFQCHGQPLPIRGTVLQPGLGMGEGTGREECSGRSPSHLAVCTSVSYARCPQRLARAPVPATVARDCAWSVAWLTRRRLETGTDSYRFKHSSAVQQPSTKKESNKTLSTS